MLDPRMLRDQLESLRSAMRRRGKLDTLGPLIDRAATLDTERRALIQATDERKAARNANSQEVARRKRAGEPADELIALGRELGAEIQRLEDDLARVEAALQDVMLGLPNITLDEVPEGGEEANRVERTWGEPRASDGVRPHWEIGEALGLIDFARGAKISGSGFIVFRGLGARLTRALLNFFIDVHVREHGYEEVWVPVVVNRAAMIGTSQLPKFEEDMYALRDEDLFLVPTAEVPVTNLYREEILDGATLPRGFVAYTPCFRREAGAAGKDTRGLLRVHEFDKV
ncbi:MAG TPA: aminoacyl--tRNA ligase-related protein, partial [Gemmatimonadaceae bacterium]